MQHTISASMQRLLSADRLSGYITKYATQKCNDPINLYVWNMNLSESLYPLLQTIEIGLRNSINETITDKFGDPFWLIGTDILEPREVRKVHDCRELLLLRSGKATIGKIIAELSFGFWTSLLDVRYEKKLWHKIIKQTFPYLPRNVCTRMHISKRFSKIRILRNRIFHFEPVWHWSDLMQQHDDIVEAIMWLNPDLLKLIQINRFKEIYVNGPNIANNLLYKNLLINEIS